MWWGSSGAVVAHAGRCVITTRRGRRKVRDSLSVVPEAPPAGCLWSALLAVCAGVLVMVVVTVVVTLGVVR
jgi:hypothetical protein